MTRDEFWDLIEAARADGDSSECPEALQDALEELPPDEIVAFEQHMNALMTESYSWRLWGAAYLINGGCSDDGFDYFRGWLITQGRKAFLTALENPDSLAQLPAIEEDVECEEILYVAGNAYESVTDKEIPTGSINLPDLGEGWDFDDEEEMKSRYPKLFARFCED